MLLLPHVAEPDFSSDLNSLGAFPGGYGYGGEMLLRVQRKVKPMTPSATILYEPRILRCNWALLG